LSDFAGGPPSLFNNTNTNNNKNLSSNMLETSHTHFGGSNMSSVETKQILNENQSVNSLRPIIYNQNDLNDTIMIDDIVSNYTIQQQQQQQLHQPDNQATTTTTTSTSHKPTKSSTEDIYTFRFSSQQPIEQFDPSGPIEQHSYLYNGSLNRPAFEIISHADIRPTTPIRFEHVKDLPHNKKHHHHRHHHHNKNYLDEFELIEHDGPADFHYKQRIYGDGGFESSSWYSNNQQHYRQNSSRSPPADHSRRRSNKARRSFTSPDNNINSNNRLNYGNQESIHAKGKPVEWQMARELRTTDWDRLKYYTDNTLHSFYERPDPNRYYSINEIDNETSRNNNNYRTRKSTTTTTTDQSNEYNNSKLKNIPNRKESSSYRSSSHDDKNSIIMSSPPPVPSSSSADHNHHHQIGEQSKNNKKTLLDYISSNSSDISSFNKLNLYKNKLIDNSNEIKNNIIIDSNKKSDINENSLYEWRRRSSSDGRGGGEEEEEELPKRRDSSSTLLSSSNNTNGKPAILTKIIRDPDTNEILSKTRIKETDLNNSSRKMSNEQLSPTTSNQLDRSNISVIDVSYNNSPRPNTFNRRLSSINQTDEQDYEISETSPTTPLPPPLPFQLNNSNIEQNNYTSIIPVNNNNNNNNNNRLSPILSKENSNSSNYESSIIESITKHANEDFQPSEILDISQQNIYHSRLESPDLYSNNNNNNNNKSVFKNSFNEKTKMILENKLTSTNNKSGNIFQDIQSFDPNQLRPVKKKISDSNYYDKIADSSSNRSSSIISNNNHNNKYKPPSVIQSISSRNNDDKSSVASSSRLSKRSSQMY